MSLRRKKEVEEENGEEADGEEADGEEEDVDGEEEDVEVSGDEGGINTIIVYDSSDDDGAISVGSVQVKKYLSSLFSGYVVIRSYCSNYDPGS